MSRASIFDLLAERHEPAVEPQAPAGQRSDYRTDRLRLVDGLALTPAGLVAAGEVPAPARLAQSRELRGPDGFHLLVQAVAEVVPEPAPRLDAKAQRLQALLQGVLVDALMLLDALPEGEGFDIVLSAPLRTAAAEVVTDGLRRAVAATDLAQGLGELRHLAAGQDPHAALAAPDEGGQGHVLWLVVDSLLNLEDIAALHRRDRLALPTRQAGFYPGEAAVALLMQRVPEGGGDEQAASAPGWWLDAAIRREHPGRGTLGGAARQRLVAELLAQAWPAGEGGEDDPPAFLVVDALGLPGRTQELVGPLLERWPALDIIEQGLGVDTWGGWPGEALTALQLALARAALAPGESALLLGLAEETGTRALTLWACGEAETDDAPATNDHPATSPADRRRS
ncbi:hypothetical protein [Halomonas mongoliensis]|uniref:hypothetical protein n=1 Tax=Halomonas mongoliensis TaxID=321265 RepID=UPI00403B1366